MEKMQTPRQVIQDGISTTIFYINSAHAAGFISEFHRLNLIADLQNIKQEVNAAFNYQSPADPPEGSPGQEDLKQ